MCEVAETYLNDNVIETSIIPNENSFQDVASRLDKLYLNFDSDTDESDLSTSVQDDFNDICFANACSPVVLDNQYPTKLFTENLLKLKDSFDDGYPTLSKSYYGQDEWSKDGDLHVRNQSRTSLKILSHVEEHINLEYLTRLISLKDKEKFFFHATTSSFALNIIKTGPHLSRKQADFSRNGAFYLNPDCTDCYEWFITRNSTFAGDHAMLVFKLNLEETNFNGEFPSTGEWKRMYHLRTVVGQDNHLDYSYVPQCANPDEANKNKFIPKIRRMKNGKDAQQLIVRTETMCEEIHGCIVAVIFYQKCQNKRKNPSKNDNSQVKRRK